MREIINKLQEKHQEELKRRLDEGASTNTIRITYLGEDDIEDDLNSSIEDGDIDIYLFSKDNRDPLYHDISGPYSGIFFNNRRLEVLNNGNKVFEVPYQDILKDYILYFVCHNSQDLMLLVDNLDRYNWEWTKESLPVKESHKVKLDKLESEGYEERELNESSTKEYIYQGVIPKDAESIIIAEGVDKIPERAFEMYESLKSITIPNSVTTMGGVVFMDCKSLKSVNIPNSVTNINSKSMFSGCESLESVTLPNSIPEIGNNTFSECKSLKSVNIPSSVTSIGHAAFRNCRSLTSVNIPNSVSSIGEDAFEWCSSLKSVDIPSSVEFIKNGAFEHCESLTTVTIPNGVTTIGRQAFRSCALKTVTIPKSVSIIGHNAFSDCNNLEEVILENPNTRYHQEEYNESFPSHTKIIKKGSSNVKESHRVELARKLLESRGYEVRNLNEDTDSNVFIYDGTNKMPESATSVIVKDGVRKIEDDAFLRCRNLKSIQIPDSVTEIGKYAFDSTGLESITIPDSVVTIGKGAFELSWSLQSVRLPKYITEIPRMCFIGCHGLESITIPQSVSIIGEEAFASCSRLETVYLENPKTKCQKKAFPKGVTIVRGGVVSTSNSDTPSEVSKSSGPYLKPFSKSDFYEYPTVSSLPSGEDPYIWTNDDYEMICSGSPDKVGYASLIIYCADPETDYYELVSTEKRVLTIAEKIAAQLSQGQDVNEIARKYNMKHDII